MPCLFAGDALFLSAGCIWIGAGFDFLDGFSARLLRSTSKFGKELDSFSDLITFGLLPGIIVARLIMKAPCCAPDVIFSHFLPTVLHPACAAIRLAKFNNDTQQQYVFIGLSSTASGLFISTLPFLSKAQTFPFLSTLVENLGFLVGLSIGIALLMVSPIRFISLKFKNYSLRQNFIRYFLIILGVLGVFTWKLEGLALTLLLYIGLSIILQPLLLKDKL